MATLLTVAGQGSGDNQQETQFGSPGKSRFSLPGFLRRSRSGSGSMDGGNAGESPRKSSLNQNEAVKTVAGGQESKKTNFYRRPGAAQKSKPVNTKPTSVASMKRKQFAQRMMWINEPVDLDDDDDIEDLVIGDERDNIMSASTDSGRTRHSLSTSPGSIIRKLAENSLDCDVADSTSLPQRTMKDCKKQTSFKERVSVYHYNDHDTVTSNSRSVASQKLKHSDLDLDNCMESRNTPEVDNRRRSGTVSPKCINDKPFHSNDNHIREDNAAKDADNVQDNATIFQSVRFEVLENSDGNCESIRLLLNLKDNVDCSKSTVKAMSGGNSLLVFTQYLPQSPGGVQGNEQFAEKVSLPLKVDPCSVKAFVHKSGCLIIDANLAWNGF